jgi:hypothetical protein
MEHAPLWVLVAGCVVVPFLGGWLAEWDLWAEASWLGLQSWRLGLLVLEGRLLQVDTFTAKRYSLLSLYSLGFACFVGWLSWLACLASWLLSSLAGSFCDVSGKFLLSQHLHRPTGLGLVLACAPWTAETGNMLCCALLQAASAS